MEKSYEKYANQINGINQIWIDTVKQKADELTKEMANYHYYTEKGKHEIKQKRFADLKDIAQNLDNLIREGIRRFCSEYKIVLPEDGTDHAADIENALRIIDMLDFDMNVDNLKNILSPLRGSFRAMKTVTDVMRAKNDSALSGLNPDNRYSAEVMLMIDEFMGINSRVNDYLSVFGNIEQIIDALVGYGFECVSYDNAPVVQLMEQIPYSYLSCESWMNEAGEMYSELENQFTTLFTNHVPTDKGGCSVGCRM